MKKIKTFELFAGIGAPRKGLRELGFEVESLGYSEIDKYAIKAYCAIHQDVEKNNFGDIKKIKELPQGIELLFHGSPCQDFSVAGSQKGGDPGAKTRSSLMWETVRLIESASPEIIIWENVKGVLNKKNKHNLEKYLEKLESLGYQNSYSVLNAVDFGIPQNRERIFVVSQKNKKFNFNHLEKKQLKNIDSFIDFNSVAAIKLKVSQATKKGYISSTTPFLTDLSFPTSKTRRGRVQGGGKISPTITCKTSICVVEYREKKGNEVSELGNTRMKMIIPFEKIKDTMIISIRKISDRETFRLMGFTDEDYNKALAVSTPNQLYKMAGNSIVVPMLEAIFEVLFSKGEEQ